MEEQSLGVEVCMPVEAGHLPNLAERAEAWLKNVWMPKNQYWERVWKTGGDWNTVAENELLAFEDDFLSSPEIRLKDDTQMLIRVFVRSSSKNWRDWLVLKLVPDLRSEFPEIKDGLPNSIRRFRDQPASR